MINILSDYERKNLINIPENIEKADLIKFYTLTNTDNIIINHRYKDEISRLGVAIQLCVLRHKGWSLGYIKTIPKAIIEYLSEQLNVNPSNFELYYVQKTKQAISKHFNTIIELYNFTKFDSIIHSETKIHLHKLLEELDDSYLLVHEYINHLKSLNIILPAIYKIEEIVGKIKSEHENETINKIFSQISKTQQLNIENLLELKKDSRITVLTWLREENGSSSVKEFIDTTKKINLLESIGINLKIDDLPTYKINSYIKLGKKYETYSLKQFESKKRISLLAIFIQDLHKLLIDRLIIIHELRMNAIFKKITKFKNNITKEQQDTIKNSVEDYIKLGDSILYAKESNVDIDKAIENEFSLEELKNSIDRAKTSIKRTNFNTLDIMDRYYNELRKYTPILLEKLSIEAVSSKSKDIVKAVEVVKDLNVNKKNNLPEEIESDFTNNTWSSNIEKESGYKKRHYYEMAVLNELKNNIRSGDISVQGSNNFKNFDNYLVSKDEWLTEKNDTRLIIKSSFDEYIQSKKEELDNLFHWFSKNKGAIDDVMLEDDKIKLKRLGSNYHEEAEKLSELLYKMIPKVGLQDILFEVAQMTNFHMDFVHAATQRAPEIIEDLTILIYSIMGIGTNVGLTKIAESLNDISYKQLAHESDWRIFEDNLQNVQARLTNYQLDESFSDFWGDGTTSSSDGMRVKSKVNALNAGYNPKLGFEKGITIYRFVNDKYSAFYTTVSNPSNRDAIHVLDGLLRHKSNLEIKEHYTDTAGYTDQVFALTSLMGFNFAPRLRNLPDLKLFSIENTLDDLSKLIPGKINTKLIKNNYDDILRLAHSIREEKVTSSLILSKLGSYARQNSLSNALKEMGKIEKTIFILKYISDSGFRRRIQVGLNKGEELNGLARVVFFGRRGHFWERELQGQLQKASCLNVILNAIVIWNTKYLTKAWNQYKSQNPNIDENLLKYISPLHWEHINFLGKYLLEMEVEFEDDNLRKLNF